MENGPSPKNLYEERKAERDKARIGTERAGVFRRYAWRAGIVVVVIGAIGVIVYASKKKETPQDIDHSVAYEVQGRDHISVGASHPAFNSNPPSSGWHYTDTARMRFYDKNETAPPDEYLIHNLEHGDIWISYRPDISGDVRELTKKLSGGKVIATPRAANEKDIAMVSWGRVDAFNIADENEIETRIRNFITRHLNKGPEFSPMAEPDGFDPNI